MGEGNVQRGLGGGKYERRRKVGRWGQRREGRGGGRDGWEGGWVEGRGKSKVVWKTK